MRLSAVEPTHEGREATAQISHAGGPSNGERDGIRRTAPATQNDQDGRDRDWTDRNAEGHTLERMRHRLGLRLWRDESAR